MIETLEHFEKTFLLFFGDSNTVVLKGDPHPLTEILGEDPHARTLAFRHELEGIAKQIGKTLGEQRWVAQHFGDLPRNGDMGPGFLELGIRINDILKQLLTIDRL